MAQICTGETAGLTDWPVERIAEAVNPDEAAARRAQRAARRRRPRRQADALGVPGRPAVDARRTHGGDAPAARSDARRRCRSSARRSSTFYASLNDEQKARFNALEPEQTGRQRRRRAKAELSQVCSTAVTKTNAAPTARIQQALRLSPEQRTALDNLDARDRPGGRDARGELPDRRDADPARTARGDGGAPRCDAARRSTSCSRR